jgi:hypothetical protein
MNAAQIQTKLYAGYAKAAAYVGQTFTQYRPTNPMSPISPSVQVRTLTAAMTVATAANFSFTKPGLAKDCIWTCLVDGSLLYVGDVLKNSAQTFFVASLEPLLPPVVILVNASITIKRPNNADPGIGLGGYSGIQEGQETAIAVGMPAYIQMAAAGRNARGDAGLPSDSPGPLKFTIWMPTASMTANLPNEQDVVYDGQGRRFQIAGYENTPIGTRYDTIRLKS